MPWLSISPVIAPAAATSGGLLLPNRMAAAFNPFTAFVPPADTRFRGPFLAETSNSAKVKPIETAKQSEIVEKGASNTHSSATFLSRLDRHKA